MSLSIKTKLVGAFAAVLLLMGALAWVSLTRLADFNHGVQHIVDVTAEKARVAAQMEAEFYAMKDAQGRMLLAEDLAAVEASHAEIKARLDTIAALRAEAGAIAAMVAAGETEIAALAVIAGSAEPVPPCGGCRQKLAEFAAGDVPVVLAGLEGELARSTVGDLLPGAFAADHMARADR